MLKLVVFIRYSNYKEFKNVLKRFLFPALLLVLVVSFVTPNSVQAAITGNNSPETAKVMGYWKYSTPDTTILPEGEDEAYYQFTINKGERVYVRSSYDKQYTGMSIEISKPGYVKTETRVINPTSLTPFIFAKTADVSSANISYEYDVTDGF